MIRIIIHVDRRHVLVNVMTKGITSYISLSDRTVQHLHQVLVQAGRIKGIDQDLRHKKKKQGLRKKKGLCFFVTPKVVRSHRAMSLHWGLYNDIQKGFRIPRDRGKTYRRLCISYFLK